MSKEAEKIIALASRHPLPLHNEKLAQEKFGEVLSSSGISFKREVRLGTYKIGTAIHKDIVDFMCGNIAVEMKASNAQRSSMLRQLTRYAAHPDVKEIILLTGRSIQMPSSIDGKPLLVANLSRAFL